MRIVGFNGSPRKNGNTAFLINLILHEAQKYGSIIETWNTSDVNISPCISCQRCQQAEKHCIIKDDMQQIYSSISSADTIVFGSPIYMGQMSAQAKVFIDRLYAEFHPKFAPQFKKENAGKNLVLVFTQGNPDIKSFAAYFEYIKEVFIKLEFNVIEPIIIATGTRSVPVNENRILLEQVQNFSQFLCNK